MNDNNSTNPSPSEPERSEYFQKLVGSVGAQYSDKIKCINSVDPYCLPKNSQFLINENGLPAVSEVDIFVYFTASFSKYTAEHFKAYKSLNAHKYVEAGFVEDLLPFKINDYFVVIAKVCMH